MPVADMAERGRDTVEEGLRTDEGMVGKKVGAVGEVLARSETDLEMQRALFAEQPLRRDVALCRHFDLRQQLLDEILLALAQLVPARTAIKTVAQRMAASVCTGSNASSISRQPPVSQVRCVANAKP